MLPSGAIGVGGGSLIEQIAEVLLPELERLFSPHDVAVTTNGVVEVELLRDVQSLDPIVGVAVAHVRRPTVESIAGDQDSFVWEIHEDIAVGVGAAPRNAELRKVSADSVPCGDAVCPRGNYVWAVYDATGELI